MTNIVIPIETVGVGGVSQLWLDTLPDDILGERRNDSDMSKVRIEGGPAGRIHARYVDSANRDSETPHTSVFLRDLRSTSPLTFEVEISSTSPVTGRFLGDQGGVTLPDPLNTLVIAVHGTIPLIFLLWILGRKETDLGRFQPVARDFVRLALLFYIAVWSCSALVNGADWLRTRLLDSSTIKVSDPVPSRAGGFGLLMVFGTLLWPAVALRVTRAKCANPPKDRRAWSGRLRDRCTALVLAGIAVIVGLWLEDLLAISGRTAVVIGLLVTATAVVVVIGGRPGRLWLGIVLTVLATAVLIVASFFVPIIVDGRAGWVRNRMGMILIAFAVLATGAFAWVIGQLILKALPPGSEGEASPHIGAVKARWRQILAAAVAGAVLAILVAPSVTYIVQDRLYSPVSPWSLVDLAFGLNGLTYFLVAGCLFVLLHRASTERSDELDAATIRRLGIALLLLLVFSDFDRWFYLPLPFLLSWLLVARVVVPHKKDSVTTHPSPEPAHLSKLLDAQAVNSRLRSMRQKYRSGDTGVTNYESQMKGLERQRDALKKAATGDRDPYLLRPADSRWQGGKRGLAYGFMFSIPSMSLYLYHRLLVAAPANPYPLLAVATNEPYSVLQWAIYGFFLGYFFDIVKGRTGIEKASWLFLVLLLHNTFLTLLRSPTSAAWTAMVFWALQTFVILALVGLTVGDYQIARRAGLGWRDLVDIHDARWVAALGASVAAAVGGLTLTLFTTAASELTKNVVHSTTVTTTGTPSAPSSGPNGANPKPAP